MSPLPEVSLPLGTVVIADLHLDLAQPAKANDLFVEFLERLDAPRLIILGDLFDYWVGPAQMGMPEAPRVLDALGAFSRRGGALDVAVGNRDFLLDSSFCERTGAELRPDGLIGLCGGKRVLLIHGDELCTKDKGYQRLRYVLRSRPVRTLGPRLPLPLALKLAKRLRRASTKALEIKPSEEKRMQADAANSWCERERCEILICGHAHALRREPLEVGAEWIVLDAFGGKNSVATFVTDGGVSLSSPRDLSS